MTRQFPLLRSVNNLIWNIKHYQPASRRPPFKASRHPFCTNLQLRNESYAFWFEETSRDLRQKLAPHTDNPSKSNEKVASQADLKECFKTYSSAVSSTPAILDEPSNTTLDIKADTSPEEAEIIRLFYSGDFGDMYRKIKELQETKTSIPLDLLSEMASCAYNELETNNAERYLLQSVIEPPLFFLKDESPIIYSSASSRLKLILKSFRLYEAEGLSNGTFLKHYIWLCYHAGDSKTLQKLFGHYTASQSWDSRTLSYIINGFIYSYDARLSTSLLSTIVGSNKPLSETVISSVLVALVKVGALYDSLYSVFYLWLTSENCESPFPKTIALMIEQTEKFGTPEENLFVNEMCTSLGYNSNSLVQMVRLQSDIFHRDRNQKKSMTTDDAAGILRVRNTLGNSKHALKVYYDSYIEFFSKYCSIGEIQFILKEMRKDNIPISKSAHDSIVQYYVTNSKFVQLSTFMKKFASKSIVFDTLYARQLYAAFINTYPYRAIEFSYAFHDWLQNNSELSVKDKLTLRSACQITISKSTLTPAKLRTKALDSRKKYLSERWSPIIDASGKSLTKSQKRAQVQFRVFEGFRGATKRGIRLDNYIVEDTLRNSNAALRVGILTRLPEMRMNNCATRLKVRHFLMGYPERGDFAAFLQENMNLLNTSDKLLIARRSMNKHDIKATSLLLGDLKDSDMTSGRHMMALTMKLRFNLLKTDYAQCMKEIEDFPLDEITLSPYIANQCRFLEKSLSNKIEAVARASNSEEAPSSEIDKMSNLLERLRGLIGDIDARLKKDDTDVQNLTQDVFQMLNTWIKASNNRDERKI